MVSHSTLAEAALLCVKVLVIRFIPPAIAILARQTAILHRIGSTTSVFMTTPVIYFDIDTECRFPDDCRLIIF